MNNGYKDRKYLSIVSDILEHPEFLKLKDMVECGCFKNVMGDIQVEPNGLTIKLNFERHED